MEEETEVLPQGDHDGDNGWTGVKRGSEASGDWAWAAETGSGDWIWAAETRSSDWPWVAETRSGD